MIINKFKMNELFNYIKTFKKLIFLIGFFSFFNNVSFGQTTDSATVYISFIVETTGKITNIKVNRVECEKCNNKFKKSIKSEAIRVISTMPDFNPREKRVKYVQPIKFDLSEK